MKDGDDICDEEKLSFRMLDAHAIIHLAAASTPKLCEADPYSAQRVNVDAVKVMNRLRGDKPLIYPNTNIGYGAQIKEDVYDENSPMHPNSIYGKTKCEGERLVLEHGHCVVFRLASLFGYSTSMRWNLLLNFMVREAVDKGRLELYEPQVRRNFLHVKDICSAFIHALDNYETMKGQVYNAGLDLHPTKTEMANIIKRQIPELRIEQVEGTDPDRRNYFISSDKLKGTGWHARHAIEDGITELMGVLRG
jgi:nucleoside-diphosphate-sugar epimerase